MPAPETAYRRQKALLWESSGAGDGGRTKVEGHFDEIDVRWINKQSQMLDPQNNVVKVDATVVTTQEIAVGSILWEGSAQELWDSLTGTGTGTGTSYYPLSDLFEVVARKVTPDLKGRVNRITLGVNRYSNTMPEFA